MQRLRRGMKAYTEVWDAVLYLSMFRLQIWSSNGMQSRSKRGAMAAGRMEKPARFRRVGACSLIPWQSTDMQRLRRGMKAEVWDAVL